MLTNHVKRRIDLPHEPGQWVEIKPLSFRELQLARDARTDAVLQRFASLPRSAFADVERPKDAGPKSAEPGDDYDVAMALRFGVVAWSYDEDVSQENVDQLDEATAKLLLDELLPKPIEEVAAKNASSRSTRR